MTLSDRLADVVRRIDYVVEALERNGIECSDLDTAAADLNEIRLEIEPRVALAVCQAVPVVVVA